MGSNGFASSKNSVRKSRDTLPLTAGTLQLEKAYSGNVTFKVHTILQQEGYS